MVEDKSFPNSKKNRFYSKVMLPNTDDGCMEWDMSKNLQEYGVFNHEGNKTIFAHRYSYELHYGKFKKNLCVLHKCDNTKCVRPSHLFLGTQGDNVRDMVQKGRGRKTFMKFVMLKSEDVLAIRERLKNKETCKAIAEDYPVTRESIQNIKSGRSWKHLK